MLNYVQLKEWSNVNAIIQLRSKCQAMSASLQKRPKKLVTSLTCQVFSVSLLLTFSAIFRAPYHGLWTSNEALFRRYPKNLCQLKKSVEWILGVFGVSLAEPLLALSFPCPWLPLFCYFFHKIFCYLDLTKNILGNSHHASLVGAPYILSEISRWTDHGKY